MHDVGTLFRPAFWADPDILWGACQDAPLKLRATSQEELTAAERRRCLATRPEAVLSVEVLTRGYAKG
jgi:hypothetical protein